jgi:solute carrier family 25 S-adenosylmethionine transporter 26
MQGRQLSTLTILLVACLELSFVFQQVSARSSVLAAASLPRKRNRSKRRVGVPAVLQEEEDEPFYSVPSVAYQDRSRQSFIPNGGAAAAVTIAVPTIVSSSAWLDGLKNGLASAMAAACVKASLQPIDTIKTLQQYHQASSGSSLTVAAAARKIMARPGGFGNFYAGLGVTVIGAMPATAIYFGVYSYCKRKFLAFDQGHNQHHKTLSIAASAAIGNSVASFSRVPYEVLKQKLQTGAYSNTWEALGAVAAQKAWWTLIFPKGGIAIQMIRDVPYAICTLLLYENLQAHLSKESQHNKAWDFCLGGIAGGIGSWVTNPMDVVKTRLQTDSAMYQGSVITCAQAVWTEGGASAFLRGSIPRLMHKVPANAFFFLFYELFRRLLRVEEAVAKYEQQKSGTQKQR